ncbi:hypothetical protein LguiA_031103 [Lonicera macranthoides]
MDQKRAETRFTGGSFTDELAGDILSNIFLELPVISLLRCKSVCKLWRQLISDPIFIKLHLNQRHQKKLLLRSDQDSFYPFNFEETCGNPVSFFPFKDLENNEFRKVALPWDPNRRSPKYLMVIRGRLCIREAELPRDRYDMGWNFSDDTVWTLKEDEQGKEWIKLMTIHWSTSWPPRGPTGPVCCLENGKILLCREQCGDTTSKERIVSLSGDRHIVYLTVLQNFGVKKR